MNDNRWISNISQLFIFLVMIIMITGGLYLADFVHPETAAAHSSDVFGPACGKPVIDGELNPGEWSTASQQTFIMVNGTETEQQTATLHVMNSANHLYMGITIDDDEYSTVGNFLSHGDGFRIDFDNDHGGTLFTVGDDVLSTTADTPQFHDSFVDGDPALSSAAPDVDNGGTFDGSSFTSRVGNDNHFELQHPICSGDSLDFCLKPGETVGFRLEYLDAEGNGDFGGSSYFPGSTDTSQADIVIGDCSIADLDIYIPMIIK